MASLTEVYEGHVRTVTTSRRLSLGAGLFAVGAAMVVGSIAVATTDLGAGLGLSLYGARELAGVLAGLGLPAAFLGVFVVLPAGRVTRAVSIIGAAVSVLGVALFRVAYPYRWLAAGDPLALATVVVYFAGAITALGCLFVGLATFKTRNDPGGTARMEITEAGRVRLVEDTDTGTGPGSVGFLGSDPDGDVTTQTNRESPPQHDTAGGTEIVGDTASASGSQSDPLATEQSSGRDGSDQADPLNGGSPAADGGSAAVDGDGTDAEFVDTAADRGRPDAYCGNCEHFEYVKVEGKIVPYCGYTDDLMDDMDACEQWAERR